MSDLILTKQQLRLRDEARAFAREGVSRQLILDMDAERVSYPREYIHGLASQGLLGLRFPVEFGGRNLDWSYEVLALEEIGVLGASLACLFSLPSIVGEAIHVFGTKDQKAKYLSKIITGQLTVAGALTEPRGGQISLWRHGDCRARWQFLCLEWQKRFIVGAEGADLFLVYARTNPDACSYRRISAFWWSAGRVYVQHVYGLMGTRGGGTGSVYFRECTYHRRTWW